MMQPPRQIGGDLAEVELPLVFLLRLAHELEALRVGADLRAVERVADGVMSSFCRPRSANVGPFRSLLAATRSSFRARRQRAKTASAIVGAGMPMSSALTLGPLAGALLAGGVEDGVDEEAVFGLSRVLLLQDVGGDLDQEGVEVALVPLGEDLGRARSGVMPSSAVQQVSTPRR